VQELASVNMGENAPSPQERRKPAPCFDLQHNAGLCEVGRGGLEPPTPGFSVPRHNSAQLPCGVDTYSDSERSRNGEAAQNPAHYCEELTLLTEVLDVILPAERETLLADLRALLASYRAGVTAESK